MTDDPNKPQGPWKLNSGRVVLLIMGTLLLAIIASTLLGGLGNYQQLKEGAKPAAASGPVTTEPASTP
jgi:hypothetical protein